LRESRGGGTSEETIPSELKSRQKIILGDSRIELPILLNKLGTVDVYLHDSLHTYEHMVFEYTEAWNHLVKGGLLLSDDVAGWPSAFIDFCEYRQLAYSLVGRMGILKKMH